MFIRLRMMARRSYNSKGLSDFTARNGKRRLDYASCTQFRTVGCRWVYIKRKLVVVGSRVSDILFGHS